ncbi:MAG: hypothetical protein E7311_00425 [Clostridiales bacterium]|nr:hypothetical protein [Clostridiales bacterium]
MKNKTTSGISLVALIVTIIVLIILTAAVIVTFMEGGIIDRAKEAVFKSDIRTYQEILAVKRAEEQIKIATGNGGESELNATELVDIKVILPEFKDEYENLISISNGEIVLGSREDNPYRDWLIDLGIEAGNLPVADIEYTIGEEVSITDEDGIEHSFYVMEDVGSTLTLLAKGAINTTTYIQENPNYIQFSETNYWYKDGAWITYDLNDYEVVKTEGQEGKAYALEAAMEYGEKLGGEGRLMTYDEAESWQDGRELETKLYEAGNYWLGIADEYEGDVVMTVLSEIETLYADILTAHFYGVRPVIIISETAIN